MSDVFLSYAREDEARIRPLVKMLEDQGLSVFWDRRIPAGETWRSYIGHALGEAHCVLVAWSWSSVSSDWVIEEAEQAKKRGVLLPFRLDPVDLPLGFGAFQAADLSDWTPGQPSPPFESFARDVLEKVQEGRRRRGPSARPPSGAVSSAPSSTKAAEAPPVPPTAVGKPTDLKPSKKPSAKPRSAASILVLVGLGTAAVIFVLSRLNQPEPVFEHRCVIRGVDILIDSQERVFSAETRKMIGRVRPPLAPFCAFDIVMKHDRYCVTKADGTVLTGDPFVPVGSCRR